VLRPENALTPRLIRREAIQLAVVVVASLAALLSGVTVLQIVAGVVDLIVAAVAAIALVVAWRAVGRVRALALYLAGAAILVALAVANFAL
jgi:hypothetical protein